MNKFLFSFILAVLPLLGHAQEWNQALYTQIEQSIAEPTIAPASVSITRFGASPNFSAERNQKAILKAIAHAHRQGGGRVVVPRGMPFKTGAIRLESHVALVVEEGATLQFVFQPSLYPIVKTRWEGLDCWNLSPCIYAYEATDIALLGKGTIDGGGSRDTWWPWCGKESYHYVAGTPCQNNGGRPALLKASEDGVDADQRRYGEEGRLRPQLVGFNQCSRVMIEDVTLLNSPFWVIHPLLSTDVTVRNVTINNDGPNGDGCDPESCNRVLIEGCRFNTGDDCIAIKSGRNNDGRLWQRPSENIIIRNCEMRNGHGGVVIGSEISGGCRNVFAHNCKMDSPNLDRVLRIKTNTCRGGVIDGIYCRDIEVGQCREAVMRINLNYEPNELCCRGFLPTVRNVLLENVTCNKAQYGVLINALDSTCNVYDVTVNHCRFNGVEQGYKKEGQTNGIRFNDLLINGKPQIGDPPYEHLSQWMAFSEMKRVPQSYLLDFSDKPKWSYVMGIELEAILDTYLRYGDKPLLDYCRSYRDKMIAPDGTITGYKLEDYNLDNVRTGHFLARLYQLEPQENVLTALLTLVKQIEHQPRTRQDGVFWHKAIYAYQVWLDGIFMGLPFYALTALMDINPAGIAPHAYNDIINQIGASYRRTLDPATGLNRHAWDETHQMFWADKRTGLSQHCWGRAQGWFTMALIEVLDALPANHPRRAEVTALLKKDLDAVLRWQDKESKLWYQVMDAPGREGNYLESTCSSMFAYALLKAARLGYVDPSYGNAGAEAYHAICDRFIRLNNDATISITSCCAVAGLGPGLSPQVKKAAPHVKPNTRRDGSFEYYISEPIRDNDAKAVGPFIWASLEMERLEK